MLGNVGLPELLVLLVIVLLLFGTKKIRSLGGDLGGAIKEFKNAMHTEDKKENSAKIESEDKSTTPPSA